eukprot:1161435-Pelagomonas_calceolata.AAC.7
MRPALYLVRCRQPIFVPPYRRPTTLMLHLWMANSASVTQASDSMDAMSTILLRAPVEKQGSHLASQSIKEALAMPWLCLK